MSGFDLLIVGSGVAGLSAAVRAAMVAPDMRVAVLTKGRLADSATRWAQGGVAAVLPPAGDTAAAAAGDSPLLHQADTLAAGVGLCDPAAVAACVTDGPARVADLVTMGAVFDRDAGGGLALAREGGHSAARVVHAGGAATGAEIERTLVNAATATVAACMEGWFAVDLIVEGGRVRGVSAIDAGGRARRVEARHTLLATGGAGGLFAQTTNPPQATGDGLAMALRAGVACADLEFVQFHPTALAHPAMPRPLLSEALRGDGATLRDRRGERFVDDLAPRDVVSAAMTARMLEQGADHLWLDATGIEDFATRYPSLAGMLGGAGLDAAADWLPVAPAAHYTCGGVLTDLDGATSLPGLWAAGETACSGVHGANRLASNSLLDGMVFGTRAVDAMVRGKEGPSPTGALRPLVEGWPPGPGPAGSPAIGLSPLRADAPPLAPAAADPVKGREQLQTLMTAGAGVLRTQASLDDARRGIASIGGDGGELSNLLTVASALIGAASARHESRGAHRRADHPHCLDEFAFRWCMR